MIDVPLIIHEMVVATTEAEEDTTVMTVKEEDTRINVVMVMDHLIVMNHVKTEVLPPILDGLPMNEVEANMNLDVAMIEAVDTTEEDGIRRLGEMSLVIMET